MGMEFPTAGTVRGETGPKATEEVAVVTVKNATFDVPPPGAGLSTVTEGVLAVAISAAGTVAVNCEPLMNWVASALPSHCTTEPETKPVPFTVSVKLGPPGAAAVGTNGWSMKGTGF
ncbi:MAG: hypothetical protein LAP13_17770 [Acidobacteriia bacterium]|nr:hypothetical protein [Terriglobia bacterium]